MRDDILKKCSLGIASARSVVKSQGPHDPAWEDSDPPSMAACLLLCAAEVERLTTASSGDALDVSVERTETLREKEELEAAVVTAALAEWVAGGNFRHTARAIKSFLDTQSLSQTERNREIWERAHGRLRRACSELHEFLDEEGMK